MTAAPNRAAAFSTNDRGTTLGNSDPVSGAIGLLRPFPRACGPRRDQPDVRQVHPAAYKTLDVQRDLISRRTLRAFRAEARAQWRAASAAA